MADYMFRPTNRSSSSGRGIYNETVTATVPTLFALDRDHNLFQTFSVELLSNGLGVSCKHSWNNLDNGAGYSMSEVKRQREHLECQLFKAYWSRDVPTV